MCQRGVGQELHRLRHMGVSSVHSLHVLLKQRDILDSMVVHQMHELLVGPAFVLEQNVGLQVLDVEFVVPNRMCFAKEAVHHMYA